MTVILDFIGIPPGKKQFDRIFWSIWICVAIFSIVGTAAAVQLSTTFQKILIRPDSPYGTASNSGFGIASILNFLFLSFVKTSALEEIIFRGAIARPLITKVGFTRGNISQALLFWLAHLIGYGWTSGEWLSSFQLVVLVVTFGFGLCLGYVNFRNGSKSIVPSWLLHGTANFFCLITLVVFLRRS